MMGSEITGKLFQTQFVSKSYHKVRPNYLNTGLIEKILEFVAGSFETPYDKAADIGCGTGLSTSILSPYFKEVIGLDPSATQIEEARRMNTNKNVNFWYFLECVWSLIQNLWTRLVDFKGRSRIKGLVGPLAKEVQNVVWNLSGPCGFECSVTLMFLGYKPVHLTEVGDKTMSAVKLGPNIPDIHSIGKAETLSMIADESLQLLTVGTAIHYFDCELFFKEVDRVLKPGGCFAQYGYINYYKDPRNLSFDDNSHPSSQDALQKCNELLVEIFTTLWKQQTYQSCRDKDVAGVTPPYTDVQSQISEFSHQCTIGSIMDYVQSLGLWQSYCMETKCDADSLASGFRERFAQCLKDITEDPASFPMKWNMELYLILARKPAKN